MDVEIQITRDKVLNDISKISLEINDNDNSKTYEFDDREKIDIRIKPSSSISFKFGPITKNNVEYDKSKNKDGISFVKQSMLFPIKSPCLFEVLNKASQQYSNTQDNNFNINIEIPIINKKIDIGNAEYKLIKMNPKIIVNFKIYGPFRLLNEAIKNLSSTLNKFISEETTIKV